MPGIVLEGASCIPDAAATDMSSCERLIMHRDTFTASYQSSIYINIIYIYIYIYTLAASYQSSLYRDNHLYIETLLQRLIIYRETFTTSYL